MKRVLTIAMMAVASIPAALIMFLGFLIIEAVHAYQRRNTTLGRIKITRADRERFRNELQELEFKVANVGPTIFAPKPPL